MTHGTLTAGQYEAAAALNLTVRVEGLKAVVKCPYCPGERTITPHLLTTWAKKGRVPTCETVKRLNRGTDCRNVPAGEVQPRE